MLERLRRDADDRDRGVSGGVRTLRHVHGLGDRRRDGRLPARRARPAPVPPPPDGGDGRGDHGRGEALMRGRLWRLAVFMFVVGFVLNLAGVVGHVLVSSFARRWFATPLPGALTTEWYAYAWREFQLDQVLGVTLTVAGTVTAAALVLGFPAAYLLARHDFRGKGPLLLLFFLPLVIPQMTYGIPLATALYRYRIGGTISGVILANLVPMLPLAILVVLPFIEQISESLEWAARVPGARRWQVFPRGVLPLSLPGLVTG